MEKKYFTRTVIYRNGKIGKMKVSREKAIKDIEKMLEEDKEMLDILAKL